MALTRSFRNTVADRAKHDAAFRAALFEEAAQAIMDGDADEARALLRDYINATLGFARLSAMTHITSKSLMRMVGPSGNPELKSLSIILRAVRSADHLEARVSVKSKEENQDCGENHRQLEPV